MIVCLCRGKSDRDVLLAIEHGATSVRDLQRCGIGTDCGSCHTLLRTVLAASVARDLASAAATAEDANTPAPAAFRRVIGSAPQGAAHEG